MDSIFVIEKNQNGNPKIPLRYGINGGGDNGYCLHRGKIVCFETFKEAYAVLETLDEKEYFDIVEYKR